MIWSKLQKAFLSALVLIMPAILQAKDATVKRVEFEKTSSNDFMKWSPIGEKGVIFASKEDDKQKGAEKKHEIWTITKLDTMLNGIGSVDVSMETGCVKKWFEADGNFYMINTNFGASKRSQQKYVIHILVTIHSFLHLPLSPYIPGMKIRGLYTLSPEDEAVVKAIDLMIIDEVSMVRCDLLDMVDDVLRHYRENDEPFGGVQVVMFGDLFQLMPVATEEDWEKLKEHYDSAYFFSSKILEKIDCPIFELKKIHRQSNQNFKALLNNVRRGHVNFTELSQLQSRYRKDFIPRDDEGYIRLTTHNYKSHKYNQERLAELKTTEYTYKAYIEEGYLSKEEWPNDYYLRLKKGARVMFIRNDKNHRYVNGTLGWVTDLGDWGITVETDDGLTINVERQVWDFYRYHINKLTNTNEEVLYASYKQYPLELAWAVTIHKSQGLTFDNVVIDAGKACKHLFH